MAGRCRRRCLSSGPSRAFVLLVYGERARRVRPVLNFAMSFGVVVEGKASARPARITDRWQER